MVRICEDTYPEEREAEYKHYYEQYPYKLHDFQKWCVEATVTGNHCMICSGTGNGKTFGGDFAINYFNSIGKKVIYCSPIKALSSEKYYLFTQKYPNIRIGIITGDVRCNTDADVLIMTTEILLNKLYKLNNNNQNNQIINSLNSFDIDINNELGCVVYDEIHFILDEHRGHVWEQSLMLLPSHIQIIGLSATLEKPEKFANWIESVKDKSLQKEVYLTQKHKRVIPLIHYSFITATNTLNKHIKDKETQQEIKRVLDKPFVIQDENGNFNEAQYKLNTKVLELFEKNEVKVKRQHVLNKVCEYLVEKEMLPALCYVFSRKQVEKCAEELTTTLLEFDSKVPYTVDYECEKIMRKLPNYEEYLRLPEYIKTVKLLRKGIGMHHAGLMAPLREMTELLFNMGYIKILFCTETMAVGINLAIKTSIFTDIYKYNGDVNRLLYAHEYTQASSRAGRLGYDTVGHCIHLNNLFRQVDYNSYRTMMNGKPQKLISKFKISYNLLLNLINNNSNDNNINELIVDYAKRSMIQYDLDNKATGLAKQLAELEADASRLEEACKTITIPSQVMDDYVRLTDMLPYTVNKKRKECERDLKKITDEYKNIANERTTLKKFIDKKKEIVVLNKSINDNQYYLDYNVDRVLHVLLDEQLLDNNNDSVSKLTIKGQIAASIRELPCLPFATLIEDGSLNHLDEYGLIAVFSCFTNVAVGEEWSTTDLNMVNSTSDDVVAILKTIDNYCEKLQDLETRLLLDTGVDYSRHYNMIEYATEWAKATCEEQCKWVLQLASEEKDIFLGEFVKAILKIVAVCAEMEAIAEMLGQVDFLYKLRQIPTLLLKYVATNQSLYI